MDWVNQCHFGDVRDVLERMAADGVKVNTIITSPPYWGLRSYLPDDHPSKAREIGSEPTLREFLETMTGVFRLCREVLADDGTMWVNMGDSYARSPAKGGSGPSGKNIAYSDSYTAAQVSRVGSSDGLVGRGDRPGTRAAGDGFKPKDKLMQPHRLAIALQDDGWWVRSDIVWSKLNPMPESVTDRPTNSHEYIFLLAKEERYYFDQDAIKEKADPKNHRESRGLPPTAPGQQPHNGYVDGRHFNYKNKRSVWTVASEPYSEAHFATFPTKLITPCVLAGCPPGGTVLDIFMGSGTTAYVAEKHGRNWIGIDLDERNHALQQGRLRQRALML